MPPPYDTVISIGGQSLVDGVWRLLGPALQGLSNPLPIALPGFSNATMRITRLVPLVPGVPPAGGALEVIATIELNAEALLSVTAATHDITISIGPQQLEITKLTGTLDLPDQIGTVTNIDIGGDYPSPIGHVDLKQTGKGAFDLPASTANLTNGNFTGTLNLLSKLALPAIPFPAIVPVAVDLTPSVPLWAGAMLQLTVGGVNSGTRFGLFINVTDVSITNITLDPLLQNKLTAALQTAVNQIVKQLGISWLIQQTPISAATVTALLAPVPNVVHSALKDELTLLLGETGRLLFPAAGGGASCDVKVLPTYGDAHLATAADNTYVLQLGFGRASSTDIGAFPPLPFQPFDTTLVIGNTFLFELLCCLLERLPGFSLPVAPVTSTTDINNDPHLMCCNFKDATVAFGPVALTGGLSLCLDQPGGRDKEISFVGHFAASSWVVDISVDFTLTLDLDLDDLASITNLRARKSPKLHVRMVPQSFLLLTLLVMGTILFSPAVGAVAGLLLWAACSVAALLLYNAVHTIMGAASLVSSPVAIPPGVFEAFGKLVPASVHVDDLTAYSVLQTPTSPWALLPRIGLEPPPPPDPTIG